MTPDDDREPSDRILDELQELRDELQDDVELVPTEPREAYELWSDQLDARDSTIESYFYRVRPFLTFLDERGIDDLRDVDTRTIKEFEAERRAGDRTPQTLNNQLGTLRLFLTFCRELQAVSDDVVEAVNVPELSKADRVNTEKIVADRAATILDNLARFRYASREHVLFLLLWRTTVRIGALRSLDVDDLFLEDDDLDRLRVELLEDEGLAPDVVDSILQDAALPFIRPRHRPESGTPLKNGDAGERVINIAESTADVLRDYLRVNRPDVVDEHGRRPLLASRKGDNRLSTSGIRNTVYILTQPCEFGDACPYGEDPETCVAREHGHGSKCPGARSPHKIRTGSITWHRDRGWPIPELADKANTSEDLIRGVYDQPEQLIRGAVRREHLRRLDENDE